MKEKQKKISLEILYHLILNLPNQIKAVIKAKGEYTKYQFKNFKILKNNRNINTILLF